MIYYLLSTIYIYIIANAEFELQVMGYGGVILCTSHLNLSSMWP